MLTIHSRFDLFTIELDRDIVYDPLQITTPQFLRVLIELKDDKNCTRENTRNSLDAEQEMGETESAEVIRPATLLRPCTAYG